MPAAVSPDPQPQPGANDDLDDLFADIIGNNASNHTGQYNNERSANQPNDIDEEVKVTKQRKPVAKLDETRLLSAAGVPKLRKISRDKLRFNGKGNEFTDMARLLNTYQLWLDDLFPKAKFLDGLAMIEKLGHKKKIQMYRKEWIDESKPKATYYEDDIDEFLADHAAQSSEKLPWELEGQSQEHASNALDARAVNAPNVPAAGVSTAEQGEDDGPDEDELDALLGEGEPAAVTVASNISKMQEDDLEPDEDELDALMAESEPGNNMPKSLFGGPSVPQAKPSSRPPDTFEDDEDAMAEMGW